MCLTGRGWTPEGLCWCDLFLLENPNMQTCLLQKHDRRGPRAPKQSEAHTALSSDLCGFHPGGFAGGQRVSFLFLPLVPRSFTKSPGRVKTGPEGLFFSFRDRRTNIVILVSKEAKTPISQAVHV